MSRRVVRTPEGYLEIADGVRVEDESSPIDADAAVLNFTGAGVSVSQSKLGWIL